MDLNGKKALVTGAGARLGRAFALGLAGRGCDVLVHYFGSTDGAEETAREIRSLGREAETVPADLREESSPENLAEEVRKRFGALDVLVNSASVYSQPEKRIADHDLLHETFEEWELSLAVNARAPFFLMQKLAPLLERSESGCVVNILDLSATEPFLSRAAHSISKAALLHATKLAAQTLAGRVRVNALELGNILPPVGLSEEEIRKTRWVGAERVVAELLEVVMDRHANGRVVRIG